MKQAKLVGVKKIALEEVPEPLAAPGQIVVKIKACGICGSDIHAYLGEHPLMKPPLVLGHEFSGTVHSLGEGVNDFQIGARVTVEPLLVCEQCDKCRSGRHNVCESLKVIGCHADGAFAEFLAVPADKVLPLPDGVSFTDGALIEPAAVAHHASQRAGLKGGEKILLFGAGTIGLFTLQMLKVYGAGSVTVVDYSDHRLQLARQLGADWTVDPQDDIYDDLKKWKTQGKAFDLIVDCVGAKGNALDESLDIAAKGSRILVVGILQKGVHMRYLPWIAEHELDLTGSFTYTKIDFEKTIALIESGRVTTKGIASHFFTLDQALEAFKFIDLPQDGLVKVVLTME